MNKLFYTAITILLGIGVCSCNVIQDASFTPPNSVSPWYYTDTTATLLGEIFIDNMHGHPNNPPPGSHVIIAWEMPNIANGMSLYIFGDTSLVPKGNGYVYALTLSDSLPKNVVRLLSADTLAIAHVFLAAPGVLKNGDTLSYSGLSTDTRILGALEDEVIAFRRGNPTINGSKGPITLSDMNCGHSSGGIYVILHGDIFPGDTKISDVKPDFGIGPGIQIDDDKQDMAAHNPFWLQ